MVAGGCAKLVPTSSSGTRWWWWPSAQLGDHGQGVTKKCKRCFAGSPHLSEELDVMGTAREEKFVLGTSFNHPSAGQVRAGRSPSLIYTLRVLEGHLFSSAKYFHIQDTTLLQEAGQLQPCLLSVWGQKEKINTG